MTVVVVVVGGGGGGAATREYSRDPLHMIMYCVLLIVHR